MTAREIADSTGCTIQKVSLWGTRVLEKKGHIKIDKSGSRNKYYSNEENAQHGIEAHASSHV